MLAIKETQTNEHIRTMATGGAETLFFLATSFRKVMVCLDLNAVCVSSGRWLTQAKKKSAFGAVNETGCGSRRTDFKRSHSVLSGNGTATHRMQHIQTDRHTQSHFRVAEVKFLAKPLLIFLVFIFLAFLRAFQRLVFLLVLVFIALLLNLVCAACRSLRRGLAGWKRRRFGVFDFACGGSE